MNLHGPGERMHSGDRLCSTIVASILAFVIVTPASGQETEPSGPSATPAGAPSVTSEPSPEPSAAALVHHRVGRLGLDYPAEWTLRPADVLMRHTHVIEFIGTAPSTAGCTTDGDVTSCGVDLALEPGTVSVAVEEPGGGPLTIVAPFERAEDPPPGTTVVEIDGVPAFLRREADAIELFVPAPNDIFAGTRLRAGVRGPGEEGLREQVEDLLASVRYEPPLQPTDQLDEEAAVAAARAVVEQKASQDRAYACFPRTPGRSWHAVVQRLPGYSRLHRRLPVTCSTKIEGTPLEVWEMTLTSSWTDGPGRSAGSVSETVWIGPDGEYLTTSRGGDPPYWP